MLALALKNYRDGGIVAAIVGFLTHDPKKVELSKHTLTPGDVWALELVGNRIFHYLNSSQNIGKNDQIEIDEFLKVLDTAIKFLRTKKGRELKQYTFSLEFDEMIRTATRYRIEVSRSGPDGYVVCGAQICGLKF